MVELTRSFKADKLYGQGLIDLVISDGSNAEERIIKHWEHNFILWDVPFFVCRDGKKSTLWKKRPAPIEIEV